MSKNYIDYCREAIRRDPGTYSSVFNDNGTLRTPPKMTGSSKKYFDEVPKEELAKMERIKIKEPAPKPQKIIVTEIKEKIKKENLRMLEIPKNILKKEYKRMWMHNYRVKHRIKKLKELYGVTTEF